MKAIYHAPATIAAPTLLIFAGHWVGVNLAASVAAGALGLICYIVSICGAVQEGRAAGVDLPDGAKR